MEYKSRLYDNKKIKYRFTKTAQWLHFLNSSPAAWIYRSRKSWRPIPSQTPGFCTWKFIVHQHIFSNILKAYRPPRHIFKYSESSYSQIPTSRWRGSIQGRGNSPPPATPAAVAQKFSKKVDCRKKLLLTSNLVCSFDKSCCLSPCRESLGGRQEILRSRSK